MQSGAEIGKVYAAALYELATESSTLESIYKELNECAAIFKDNPELVKLFSAPNIPLKDKLDIVGKVFDDGVIQNLICVMTRNRRITRINDVCIEFNKKYNEFKNIAEMTVYTVKPLEKTEREALIKKLSDKYGKTVKLTEKSDPDLIGGIVVRYGNKVMDGSVKAKLRKVASDIKQAN